jgi:hypothetical protein
MGLKRLDNKYISLSLVLDQNKLERLLLLISLYLLKTQKPTRVEHLTFSQIIGCPEQEMGEYHNLDKPGTNTLAYLSSPSATKKKII